MVPGDPLEPAIMFLMTNATASPRKPRQQRHQRLTAWQACHALTLECYKATAGWNEEGHPDPLAEEIQLSAMRAGVHIRLGAEEPAKEDFRRELRVAIGKLTRLECALEMARAVGRLPAERYGEVEASRDHAEKLTRGLYLALRKSEKAGDKK